MGTTLPQKSSSKARRKKGRSRNSPCEEEEDIPLKNSSSSKMLAKAFKIDVTQCQHCKGDMDTLAAITNRSEVARYLKHLDIEHEAPARAPSRYYERPFEFLFGRYIRKHHHKQRILMV